MKRNGGGGKGESKGQDWMASEGGGISDCEVEDYGKCVDVEGVQIHMSSSVAAADTEAQTQAEAESQREIERNHMNPLRRYFGEHSTCPVGRINASLATKGSSLLIYGVYSA